MDEPPEIAQAKARAEELLSARAMDEAATSVDTYATALSTAKAIAVRNPTGPADSFDPQEPGQNKRVLRGGSFLCSDQYCARYIVGTRGKGEPSSGCSHIGFRCVKSP